MNFRRLPYATKARLVSLVLPLLIITPFVALGYHSTRSLFADAPPVQGITVFTSQPSYTTGQIVNVTLSNSSRQDVYVQNNCPRPALSVYRQQGSAWVLQQPQTKASKCVGEPQDYKLPADRSVRTDYSYWPSLFAQPGRYRIVVTVEGYAPGPSTEFSVSR